MALPRQSRKAQKVALQPGKIRVRLVQDVACLRRAGLPVPPNPQTTVLGRSLVPSWSGLNGRTPTGRGFTEGTYERRMQQEGTFTLLLPNATGPDGVLHRERLLSLDERTYRPGDEWFEVWRASGSSRAGDLLFVGTPTQAQISETEIQLSGYDAWWALKLQRETTAGFWVSAARDVIEEFTKGWQALISSGFDDTPTLTNAQNFPTFTDLAVHTSADGNWTYQDAGASPIPGFVRLQAAQPAYVQAAATLNIGLGGSAPLTHWRAEGVIVLPAAMGTDDHVSFGLTAAPSLGAENAAVGLYVSGANINNVQIFTGGTPTARGTVMGTNTILQAGSTSIIGGPHAFAIEGRGRWVFFYVDGRLAGLVPMPAGSYIVSPYFCWQPTTNNTRQPAFYADVDYVLHRQRVPYLMRSAADKGDYSLPGAPTPGGLQGSYFNDADLASDPNMGAKQLSPMREFSSAQTPQIYARRLDPSLIFGHGSSGLPAGPTTNLSARWTGSVYLDLANYDYKLYVVSQDGARVWVGKTRITEQIVDTWTNTNSPSTPPAVITGRLKGTTGTPGPLYGQPSGWYPIVVEWQRGTGLGGTASAAMYLSYQRSDMAAFARTGGPAQVGVPINVGPYAHTVLAATGLAYYWPLDDTGVAGIVACGEFISGSTLFPAPLSTLPSASGPIPNDVAPNLDGTSQYLDVSGSDTATGNSTGFSGLTIEAWINPTSIASTQFIAHKFSVLGLYLSATGVLNAQVGNGATTSSVVSSAANAIVAGVWQHVAASYDGTNLTLYVNGVQVAHSNIGGGWFGSSTVGLQVGDNYDGTTRSSYFGGGIAHVAIYNTALSVATLLAHYQAQNATLTLNAGPSQFTAASAVPASPQGIFDQQVRNDSHYDQQRNLVDSWGYQVTCRPMSLESGEFPGRMCPRIREGSDSDLVLDHDNTLSPQLTLNAEDVADAFLADAQGLADPNNSGQLYAEMFNFAELFEHMLIAEQYDSPGDIQNAQQLARRLQSLMALRSGAWASLDARVPGKRVLADGFPATGALAERAWLPGDGLRRYFPKIGLEDASPVQLLGIAWQFVPDGIAAPQLKFRSRPRNFRETLRQVIRQARVEQRNYQQQFVKSLGSMGQQNAAGIGSDATTRIGLPTDLSAVIRATFVVHECAGGTWTISVNGTSTGITYTAPGRYDVTPWIARDGTNARMYATATGGGTNVTDYQLELLERV